MTAIAHGRELASTDQDFTGDTNWHTVLTAAASNFVAGGKYLLLCTIDVVSCSSTSITPAARTCHGTTPTEFAGSEMFAENVDNTAGVGHQYRYWTVFTQPGSAEDILIQVMIENGTATVQTRGTRVIQWLRLDADLTENTDWFYAEDNTSDVMSVGSFETRASISLDPPVAGDDWLILGRHRLDNNGGGAGGQTLRLVSDPSGSPTQLGGSELWVPNDQTDRMNFIFGHVIAAHGDAAVTYAIQDNGGNILHTHTNSAVFALNLSKFAQHQAAYDADVVNGATSYTDITPDPWTDPDVATAGDWFVLAFAVFDAQAAARRGQLRIQVDGTTVPTGWELGAALGIRGAANGVEIVIFVPDMPNLATGVRSIDLDGVVNSVLNTPEWQNRTLVAWSMELAAGGASHTRTVTDVLGLVDAATRVTGYARDRTDPLGLLDVAARDAASARDLVDALGLTDSAAYAIFTSHERTVTDTLGVLDSVTREAALLRALTDGLSVADAVTRETQQVRLLTDPLGLTDALLTGALIERALTDALGLTDAVTREAAIVRELLDPLGLLDDATYVLVGGGVQDRTVTDALGITDSIVVSMDHVRTITDLLGITDAVAALMPYPTVIIVGRHRRTELVGVLDPTTIPGNY